MTKVLWQRPCDSGLVTAVLRQRSCDNSVAPTVLWQRSCDNGPVTTALFCVFALRPGLCATVPGPLACGGRVATLWQVVNTFVLLVRIWGRWATPIPAEGGTSRECCNQWPQIENCTEPWLLADLPDQRTVSSAFHSCAVDIHSMGAWQYQWRVGRSCGTCTATLHVRRRTSRPRRGGINYPFRVRPGIEL